MTIKLSDFKVGQKCYCELDGNAKRYKNKDELIEEWEVVKIGRKYVEAKKHNSNIIYKFSEEGLGYGGLVQKTEYCVDYILYPNKEQVENRLHKEQMIQYIRSTISYDFILCKLEIDDLEKICDIVKKVDERDR